MCALDFVIRKNRYQVTSAAAKSGIYESDFWGAATSTVLIEGKHSESLHADTQTVTASKACAPLSPSTFTGRLVKPGLR